MILLCDIEGTTTSISFVTDVLFPYASHEIEPFLTHDGHLPDVQAACALEGLARVLAVARRQMAGDIKATGLKTLQGLIWRHGYQSGAVHGHVYPDVPGTFQAWVERGDRVAIYSSGSVLAQQLLFRHSVAGDLTPLISAHFDTTTGAKKDPASYVAIATALAVPASEVLFCSDVPAEVAAALAGGMRAALLMRPGNAPLPAGQPCPVVGTLPLTCP